MMASPAEILRACLIDQNLVLMPMLPGQLVPYVQTVIDATPCYVSSLPSDPDQVVAIFDSSGILFGRAMNGKRMQHVGIKVVIRSPDYGIGYTFTNKIALAIESINLKTIKVLPDNTTHYVHSAFLTSPFLPLGEEVGNKRQLFSINARMSLQDIEPSLG